ncbi:ATP-binding protein [Brucella pseudogrignonensis]|uniref:histidine kinase n=1 Tax=Brucella pseudogrignonensis TaxID=419475 RepID=A0ABU1MCF0_9HYPH|nr:ATP-binding protein [Brucella pseudogrignonensis]MDR6433724.1 signal transduction histidine kinase [Brucella pseudogrignonensis]
MFDPIARQIVVAAALAEEDADKARSLGVRIETAPDIQDVDERATDFIAKSLRSSGRNWEIIVSHTENPRSDAVSVYVQPGKWLITQIPRMGPPPGRNSILAMWVVTIILGSGLLALWAANKATKSLRLLEDAVSHIGPDGTLNHVPETGSAEIRATARALNNLSLRLKNAMESRMRLVAAAGHDLRTPMTRMRLRAEFVADAQERAKWLSDLEELDLIADSAIRLVREEVGGAEETQPLRVNELIGGLVSELSTLGYSVELSKRDYDKQTTVVANPIALTRALRNLIINAATHGEHAKVSWCTDGKNVVVQIEDDGPGIPEEMIEHIFEPFFRVDAGRRKKHPGAGLGMAIAKEIIERLGGTITVENKTPKGFMQRVMIKAARK